MDPIYLDYNATTPIHPEVIEAMKPYLEQHFGNPSSRHIYGRRAKQGVENARLQIAKLLHAKKEEIVFTSGGTESNNFAIKGFAFANMDDGNHIITSQIEHPAVMEVCKALEKNGFSLTYLPVDKYGEVSLNDVEKAITPKTILISIMHANNEVGTIQNIAEISKIAKKHDICVHTDAAQSPGKIPVDVRKMRVDLLSIAGHKLYAPKGIGALYIRKGTRIKKFIHGASHEMNLRAGTENVLEIVGLGKACEIAVRDFQENYSHMKKMRDLLREKINNSSLKYRLNGHPENCLPNTLSIGFYDIKATEALTDMVNIAASAGSACHANNVDISTVLKAMKVPEKYAKGTIRFSTGKFTTKGQIEKAAKEIIRVIGKLR